MKKTHKARLFVAAVLLAAVASGTAEARRPGSGGTTGGGGITTNYGCKTLAAGTPLRSIDNTRSTTLTTSTWACYLCNMTTHVCSLQSPQSLIGWTFVY